MRTLFESILDMDNTMNNADSAIKTAKINYDHCITFIAWYEVADELFNDGKCDINHWKQFLLHWINDSDFHTYFDVDAEEMIDVSGFMDDNKNDSIEYINSLTPNESPRMKRSSGSSLEHFFDSDQLYICGNILNKLAKALNKHTNTDISKKIREIKKKYL